MYIYMVVYMGVWIDLENKVVLDVVIVFVFVYVVGWFIGFCIVQYFYGIEIYFIWIRSFCYVILMCFYWFFQFVVVCVILNMFESLDIWGVYVFWVCICVIGMVLFGLMVFEIKGVFMEWMYEFFEGFWYMIWWVKLLFVLDMVLNVIWDGSIYEEKVVKLLVQLEQNVYLICELFLVFFVVFLFNGECILLCDVSY